MRFVTLANRLQLPPRKGLYFIKLAGERRYAYVGKAVNIRARHSKHDVHQHMKPGDRIYYQEMPWPYWVVEHHEAVAIKRLKPRLNNRQETSNISVVVSVITAAIFTTKVVLTSVIALVILFGVNYETSTIHRQVFSERGDTSSLGRDLR